MKSISFTSVIEYEVNQTCGEVVDVVEEITWGVMNQ